jgi:hypothetical protein
MKQVADSQTQTVNYNKWRWLVFAFTLIPWLIMTWGLLSSPARTSGSMTILMLTLAALVGAAWVGAAMCYQSARQFGKGEAARWVWLLISLFSVVDGLIVLTTWVPSFFPGRGLTTPLVISSNALAIVARILTGCSFLMMIRIYRQSGFRLKLRSFDYCAFVVLLAAEVAMVMVEGNMARISSLREPGLEQWLKVLLPISNLMLVVCSALGIMIWRYARQMGGGLVAKAWQFVVLYLCVYIIRRLELGLFGGASALGLTIYYGLGFACSYLLYLGASFQYEACTRSVESSDEELLAELSALELQQAKL